MTIRFAGLTVDCRDPAALARFWQAVLGGEVRVHDAGWAGVVDVPGTPAIWFQRVPEDKSVKNRVHIDVRTDEPTITAACKRVVALGGRVLTGYGQDSGDVSRVLADPEGNEFCLSSSPES